MAKYEITRKCGCVEEVSLFGSHKERNSKIVWMEKQTCRACKTDAAVEKSAMTGSDKQIAWAESIKAKMMADFEKVSNECKIRAAEGSEMHKAVLAKIEAVKNETSAKWWIDNRSITTTAEYARGVAQKYTQQNETK